MGGRGLRQEEGARWGAGTVRTRAALQPEANSVVARSCLPHMPAKPAASTRPSHPCPGSELLRYAAHAHMLHPPPDALLVDDLHALADLPAGDRPRPRDMALCRQLATLQEAAVRGVAEAAGAAAAHVEPCRTRRCARAARAPWSCTLSSDKKVDPLLPPAGRHCPAQGQPLHAGGDGARGEPRRGAAPAPPAAALAAPRAADQA